MVKKRLPLGTMLSCLAVLTVTAGVTPTDGAPRLSLTPAAATALPDSPPGKIMVVTTNIRELLYGDDDNGELQDLGNYARRMARVLPYTPDAILVQEVKLKTAQNLVLRLNQYLPGGPYSLVAEPADTFPMTKGTPGVSPDQVRESAIILNTRTMKLRDGEIVRWEKFEYPESAVADGKSWQTNQAPYLRVVEVDGGLVSALWSVHFKPDDALRYPGAWKGTWANEIMQTYQDTYPKLGPVPVIAGDFNHHLCTVDSTSADSPDCTKTTMWANFSNGGYHTAWPKGIDHIFTQGAISTSGKDSAVKSEIGYPDAFLACTAIYDDGRGRYDATGACYSEWYSDHVAVWALVGPRA